MGAGWEKWGDLFEYSKPICTTKGVTGGTAPPKRFHYLNPSWNACFDFYFILWGCVASMVSVEFMGLLSVDFGNTSIVFLSFVRGRIFVLTSFPKRA